MSHFTPSYLLVTTSKQKLFVYLLKEIVPVSKTTIWGNVQEWNCVSVEWLNDDHDAAVSYVDAAFSYEDTFLTLSISCRKKKGFIISQGTHRSVARN